MEEPDGGEAAAAAVAVPEENGVATNPADDTEVKCSQENPSESVKDDGELPGMVGQITLVQGVPSGRRQGLVDLEFDCSTVCPTLPWLVGIWQKWLGRWAK